MFNKIKFFLFCSITLFSTNHTEAATLHSILIGNTHDYSIGDTVKIDIEKMKLKSKEIAYHTDMELNLVEVVGEDFEKSIILDKLESVDFEEDDAVLLYYSGHGYRTDNTADNIWPNIAMHSEWTGINQYYLTEILINKSPRFILSIADACNNIIPEPYAPYTVRAAFYNVSDEIAKSNYIKLFVKSHAYIIASGSGPGQYSYCDDYNGGHFTNYVLKSLDLEVANQDGLANWDVLLTRAKNVLWKQQKPQFEIIYPENVSNQILTNKKY